MNDDPGRERELRDHYARMPDGELSSLAADEANLTDEPKPWLAKKFDAASCRRRRPSSQKVTILNTSPGSPLPVLAT
jgi:hypothetical protein